MRKTPPSPLRRRLLIVVVLLSGVMILAKYYSVSSESQNNNKKNYLWKDVCTQEDTKLLPFCDDKGLSRKERVHDYVQRIQGDNIQDKANMMMSDANAYDKLHIPKYNWWSEGLHGPLQNCVCDNNNDNQNTINTPTTLCKCPTSFPCPSALGSTFNNSLYKLIGQVIGREGRAINNLHNHNDNQLGRGDGITYWSPTINMQRDPRWGRNQEVPGEDPMLTGQYAANFVQGLQEGDINDDNDSDEDKNNNQDHYVQIVAACKHYLANSLESWGNYSRHNINVNITKSDLQNYYLPPFRACVMEGRSLGIMCSYNSINGVPACANRWLLQTVLRDTWGFNGYVTSDCGAIFDIYAKYPRGHQYVSDGNNATAFSIQAGTDLNCGGAYNKFIPSAIQNGLLSEEQVDQSFTRLVDVQMRLGLFDSNKDDQPFFQYGIDNVDTTEHQQLALESAHQSIVLLKNNNNVLPLRSGRKVAVIGPHVNAAGTFLSNYHGQRCVGGGTSCMKTPLHAISEANSDGITTGALGCEVNSTRDEIAAAVTVANTADDVVLLVGLDQSQETEGRDRVQTTLPGLQESLVAQILDLGKPTTLFLIGGGTISLGSLKDMAPAIVFAPYGGERGAEAIADVLYGSYNPSGKLAATVYPPEYVNAIPLTEMGLTVPPGRTHMFYTGKSEFEFGHGLSYTSWHLNWATKQQPRLLQIIETSSFDLARGGKMRFLEFKVRVLNTGKRAGKQTVLAFMVPTTTETTITQSNNKNETLLPLKQKLLAYESVASVQPGEDQTLEFRIDLSRQLAVANTEGHMVVLPGVYDFVFRDGVNELKHTITLTGTPVVVERFPTRAAGGERAQPFSTKEE